MQTIFIKNTSKNKTQFFALLSASMLKTLENINFSIENKISNDKNWKVEVFLEPSQTIEVLDGETTQNELKLKPLLKEATQDTLFTSDTKELKKTVEKLEKENKELKKTIEKFEKESKKLEDTNNL